MVREPVPDQACWGSIDRDRRERGRRRRGETPERYTTGAEVEVEMTKLAEAEVNR